MALGPEVCVVSVEVSRWRLRAATVAVCVGGVLVSIGERFVDAGFGLASFATEWIVVRGAKVGEPRMTRAGESSKETN